MNLYNLYSSWLSFETYSFTEYVDFMESNFETTFNEIEKRFKELQSTPDDDPIRETEDNNQSYFDHLIDSTIDEHSEKNIFQQRYRYSVIIQLFIFFETEITKILNIYDKDDLTKHSGSFLVIAKKTFKKDFNISNFPEYNFIANFLELRNVLVHHNGKLNSNNTKTTKRLNCIKVLKKYDGFTLKETLSITSTNYQIEIENRAFLIYSVKQLESFLDEIYKNLKK